jgi:hypothetical protein
MRVLGAKVNLESRQNDGLFAGTDQAVPYGNAGTDRFYGGKGGDLLVGGKQKNVFDFATPGLAPTPETLLRVCGP